MNFDLVGRIKLRDEASKTLAKVRRSTEQAQKATKMYTDTNAQLARIQSQVTGESTRMSRSFDRVRTTAVGTGRALRSTASSMGATARQTAGLTRSIGALAAGYLSAKGAASLFNKTIGAAANYEMRQVTVEAMFGKASEKNAKEYLDFVQSRADVSMFTMDDFLDAGKSFIPTTKDIGQIKRMVNLAERLGALDTEQGLTGGAYALREYFSGDAISLSDRFEISKKVLDSWRKLPLEQQLDNLDKYLGTIGASNELLERQSQTTLGQYRKSIGQINRAFREMGTETLRKINPLLEDFNKWLNGADFAKFKSWSTSAFSGLVSGAVDAVRKAGSYIDKNFINNPEFQQLPDIQAKIKFIFNTLWQDFKKWYDSDGRAKVQAIATDLTNTLAAALKASPELLSAAAAFGVDLGSNIIKGVLSDPLLATLLGGGAAAKILGGSKGGKGGKAKGGTLAAVATNPYVIGGSAITAAMGYVSSVWEDVKSNPNSIYGSKVNGGSASKTQNTTTLTAEEVTNLANHIKGSKGHSGGLDNVPYNGYYARLHKGEAVLTRSEAKAYRGEEGASRGAAGGGAGQRGNVVVTGNTFNVRQESDIEAIADALARKIAW